MTAVRFLVFGAILAGPAGAGELPMLVEKPWLGCFAGYETGSFDAAVGADGETIIYHKDRGGRLSDTLATKVRYILEEEVDGKWVKRRMQEDGFETSQEADADAEEVSFTATFTGGTKVEVHHEFGRSGVVIGVKVVAKETANPVRPGIEAMVGDLYRNIERDVPEGDLKDVLRDKIRRTRLEIEPFTGSGKRYDLSRIMKDAEEEEFEKLIPKLKTVELSSERLGGNRIGWSTERDGHGYLELRKTKPLYHGFYVTWRPLPGKEGQEGTCLDLKLR